MNFGMVTSGEGALTGMGVMTGLGATGDGVSLLPEGEAAGSSEATGAFAATGAFVATGASAALGASVSTGSSIAGAGATAERTTGSWCSFTATSLVYRYLSRGYFEEQKLTYLHYVRTSQLLLYRAMCFVDSISTTMRKLYGNLRRTKQSHTLLISITMLYPMSAVLVTSLVA